MSVSFVEATRKRRKLRIQLEGPSGSGKTMSALYLARGILNALGDEATGKKIKLIDTENDSASLYADAVQFLTAPLDAPYTPEKYIEYIKAATSSQDCAVLIIDSTTHEWAGPGGCLEIHGRMTGNTYTNWGKVLPRHIAFIEAITSAPCHIITTVRSKTAYEIEEENGKKVPKKVGMAPIQRDGMEYEMDVVLSIEQSTNLASVSKNRTPIWQDLKDFLIAPVHGQQIIDWLNSGVVDEDREFSHAMIAKAIYCLNEEELAAVYLANKDAILANKYAKTINYQFNMRREAIQQAAQGK